MWRIPFKARWSNNVCFEDLSDLDHHVFLFLTFPQNRSKKARTDPSPWQARLKTVFLAVRTSCLGHVIFCRAYSIPRCLGTNCFLWGIQGMSCKSLIFPLCGGVFSRRVHLHYPDFFSSDVSGALWQIQFIRNISF